MGRNLKLEKKTKVKMQVICIVQTSQVEGCTHSLFLFLPLTGLTRSGFALCFSLTIKRAISGCHLLQVALVNQMHASTHPSKSEKTRVDHKLLMMYDAR